MAKKDDTTKRGITREQLLKIWPVLGIKTWFDVAKEHKPDHRFTYVNGSTELRFPILRDSGVWGAGFWDWGAIADTGSEFYPTSIRHGVGVGLRWLLSGQIPIRIDYGFAIGRRVRDIQNTGLVKTQTLDDFGALSFSVLYSF